MFVRVTRRGQHRWQQVALVLAGVVLASSLGSSAGQYREYAAAEPEVIAAYEPTAVEAAVLKAQGELLDAAKKYAVELDHHHEKAADVVKSDALMDKPGAADKPWT